MGEEKVTSGPLHRGVEKRVEGNYEKSGKVRRYGGERKKD